MAISVAYEVLADGYEVSGDIRTGLKAKVNYLVDWANAFTFGYELLAAPSSVKLGLITFNVPYQFPAAFSTSPCAIYAQRFVIKPAGASGSLIPTGGLAPGEFFTKAIVTVDFETITAFQQQSDDPQGLNQLDPQNPITACEQSLEITGKAVTRKGSGYVYTTGSFVGKPVPGDVVVNQNEVKLVLSFPRVPFLPWQLIQPYVGKINASGILQSVQGSLLLEGLGTKVTPSTSGGLAQNATLKFAWNPDPTGENPQGMDWNSFPLPDGSGYSIITGVGGSNPTPYSYANFANIFSGLEF